jgi:type III restriction enzyme
MARLKQWCADTNQAQLEVRYDFVYVDEEGYKKYKPKSFADLVKSFREYQE